jgi:hypothetical protein
MGSKLPLVQSFAPVPVTTGCAVPCNTTTQAADQEATGERSNEFPDDCGKPKKQNPDPCLAPSQPLEDRLDANRGVQQGAR